MFAYSRNNRIKQLCQCFMRTTDRFVMIRNLDTIFLPLYLKDLELRRALSYLKSLSHNGCKSVKMLDNIDIHSLFKQKLL